MDQLNRLPEVSEHVLCGLKADDRLKHQILLKAAESPQKKGYRFRTVIAMCSLSFLLILMCLFVSGISGKQQDQDLKVMPAVRQRKTAPVNLQQVIDEASGLIPEEMNGTDE